MIGTHFDSVTVYLGTVRISQYTETLDFAVVSPGSVITPPSVCGPPSLPETESKDIELLTL